jgi:hypothetical protein
MTTNTKPHDENADHTSIVVAIPRSDDRQFARALSEAAVASDYVIDSPDMAEFAAAQLAEYKRQSEAIEARRVSITGPMNVSLRNVNALFKSITDKLDEASRLLRSRMLEYSRREQQRIAEENATRERAAREARQELEARAAEAANAGRQEEAFALSTGASVLTAPVTPVRVAKVAGISTRTNWIAECTDLAALVDYVSKHPEYLNLLQPNQAALTAIGKAQKSALKIPGVRAYDRGGIAVRA